MIIPMDPPRPFRNGLGSFFHHRCTFFRQEIWSRFASPRTGDVGLDAGAWPGRWLNHEIMALTPLFKQLLKFLKNRVMINFLNI
jgi:hypothetical protein